MSSYLLFLSSKCIVYVRLEHSTAGPYFTVSPSRECTNY